MNESDKSHERMTWKEHVVMTVLFIAACGLGGTFLLYEKYKRCESSFRMPRMTRNVSDHPCLSKSFSDFAVKLVKKKFN